MAQESQVGWREWGQAAFAEAAEKGRPVLLSISAVWCHWCHVMDRTTYQDPEVIERIGGHFVPVRVDSDRRPDVNSRYNMGGWPTTAFLTPEGEILTGATYLPAGTMRELLDRVATFHAEHREDIRQEVAGRKRVAPPALPAGASAGLDATEALSAAREVARSLAEAYDPDHGGFGVQPKFPQPKALEYLLVTYLRDAARGDPQRARWASRHLEMVETTLRAMGQGGMYDHVAGGFFRYSTTRDWSVPHYEKMLEDNAQLLAIYARLARLTADPVYLDTVRDVVRYLEDWLRSDDGYFCGSQDADEAYYALDAAGREERRDTAPRVDRTLYSVERPRRRRSPRGLPGDARRPPARAGARGPGVRLGGDPGAGRQPAGHRPFRGPARALARRGGTARAGPPGGRLALHLRLSRRLRGHRRRGLP